MSLNVLISKINQIVNSRELLDAVGELIIEIIYNRVKSGKGVSDDTVPDPAPIGLAKLSRSYVEYRRKVRLGEFGSPAKSNLTLTGQMLNNLVYKVLQNRILVDIANTKRTPPITSTTGKKRKKKRSSNLPTNKDVAEFVRENGRPFLALTPGEQRIVSQFVDEFIEKKLRSLR